MASGSPRHPFLNGHGNGGHNKHDEREFGTGLAAVPASPNSSRADRLAYLADTLAQMKLERDLAVSDNTKLKETLAFHDAKTVHRNRGQEIRHREEMTAVRRRSDREVTAAQVVAADQKAKAARMGSKLAEARSTIAKLQGLLEGAHTEIASLRSSMVAAQAEAVAERVNLNDEWADKHDSEMLQGRAQHASTLAIDTAVLTRLKTDQKAESEAARAALQAEHGAKVASIMAMHDRTVALHDETVARMMALHEETIAQMTARHEATYEKTVEEHEITGELWSVPRSGSEWKQRWAGGEGQAIWALFYSVRSHCLRPWPSPGL